MKLKILGNVKHGDNLLSLGDVVEMEEIDAKALVEAGAAELSKNKITKKLSKPQASKGFQIHLKTKETEKKVSKEKK